MKKIFTFLILTYLLFTINSSSVAENEKILKIGVLLPISGEYQEVGESFLKAIQLALYDISNDYINIYLKDGKGNALDTLNAAKEFEEEGITIVIGPVFYNNLKELGQIDSVTFISLTNRVEDLPKNVISFGINIYSQINVIKEYFKKKKISKTLFLSPKTQFIDQAKIIKNSDLKFKKSYFYDVNPKTITGEIEKITNYQERKKDLERRIKILEKSDLYKDKNELILLEQKHTLGEINFDSVLILDFGERLKSVLTSFMFSDVSSKKVDFFTINQWFDNSFFNENALQNLYFPSVDFKNINRFDKKFTKTFNEKSNAVSILAYDALGLIYYCWSSNNFKFKKEQLFNKKGFKGLHGEFFIENNLSKQKLKIYKVSEDKFIKVY